MFLVDANVLLYAMDEESHDHVEARTWMASALSGRETVGFAWVVLLAFLRVATHAAAYPNPLALEEAAGGVEAWLSNRTAVVVEPSVRHLALMRGLLSRTGTAGNLVTDAHLAALALEHDATVVSFDRDFGRFEGVRWQLPG